jgi:hypothetical protein
MTDGEPDLRLSLSYDHSSGAYAGASVIGGETARDGVQGLGYIAYAGLAGETAAGLGWDIGATNSHIIQYLPMQMLRRQMQGVTYSGLAQTYTRRSKIEYSEFYTGLSIRDVSARLYISPEYLGQNFRTAYLDVTATLRPMNRLRLFGHIGALTPIGGSTDSSAGRERYDLNTGAAWQFRRGEVQLSWTATTPQVQYPVEYRQKSSALSVSVTGFF